MYIAVTKIPANPGGRQAVIESFRRAMPDMKQFSGFLGLEIWTAQDGSLQAVSRWTSKEAVEEYISHSAYGRHHSNISSEQRNAPDLVSYYEAEVIS
ncbi:MAG: antibiotic biosynthesis monooxygenase [Ktedonobacteraceae bacterium]|nr:antibiotic biosynthesis monooxygenase [Ktedonobacteraceae bacterium]